MVVTVAGQPGKDVPLGTLRAILRSAGLERKSD
jgi:predicted RNA binding protein YcfA (HicA-like mRNA interferase family)